MITYAWSFGLFRVALTEGALENVVKEIDYRLIATDGDRSETIEGAVALPAPKPGAFIPYADITEAIATVWVEPLLPKAKANLQKKMAEPATDKATLVIRSVPWP